MAYIIPAAWYVVERMGRIERDGVDFSAEGELAAIFLMEIVQSWNLLPRDLRNHAFMEAVDWPGLRRSECEQA